MKNKKFNILSENAMKSIKGGIIVEHVKHYSLESSTNLETGNSIEPEVYKSESDSMYVKNSFSEELVYENE